MELRHGRKAVDCGHLDLTHTIFFSLAIATAGSKFRIGEREKLHDVNAPLAAFEPRDKR